MRAPRTRSAGHSAVTMALIAILAATRSRNVPGDKQVWGRGGGHRAVDRHPLSLAYFATAGR